MKYIIDIEDEYTKDWVNETPMCKELCMPISVPNRHRTYHVLTGFKLEPYTVPDHSVIEDEVWKLAKKIGSFNGLTKHELDECFGHTTIQGVMTTYDTYQEAKEKYEAWKKSKEEIHVGDEVTDNDLDDIGVVTYVDDSCYCILWSSGVVSEDVRKSKLRSTGRHFNITHDLLKKMKEQ